MAHVSLPMPGSSSGHNDGVGHGTIYDSSAYNAPTTTTSSLSTSLPTWTTPSSASQYRLPPSEILKGVANRFVHSTIYLYLYASMALASLFTVLLSLVNECPGDVFYVVEMVVNVVLVVEVGVRGVAFGRQFWHSTFNILDVLLVLLCTITLIVIFFSHSCSPLNRSGDRGGRAGKSEELLDSFLLVFRNGMQLIRLMAVVRRSGRNAWTGRPRGIELDAGALGGLTGGGGAYAAGRAGPQQQQQQRRRGGAPDGTGGGGGGAAGNDFALDIDLEDDAAAHRSRMRQGGDRGAKGLAPERQPFAQDYHSSGGEEDEEL